jgi:hypothetical protein
MFVCPSVRITADIERREIGPGHEQADLEPALVVHVGQALAYRQNATMRVRVRRDNVSRLRRPRVVEGKLGVGGARILVIANLTAAEDRNRAAGQILGRRRSNHHGDTRGPARPGTVLG